MPQELSASWCFVLFCLLVFDILIASSSMTTRSPGLHCPAPPGPARPRQATAAAPRSRSFLCCAHRAGCDAASFCLGNGMCLSNVCSGVLQVEGDGQPENPRSPSATPLPSSADLGEEVRARRALPRNCPPPGATQGCGERVCPVRVSQKGGVVHAFARWRRPWLRRRRLRHPVPLSRERRPLLQPARLPHPAAVRRAPRATAGKLAFGPFSAAETRSPRSVSDGCSWQGRRKATGLPGPGWTPLSCTSPEQPPRRAAATPSGLLRVVGTDVGNQARSTVTAALP